MRKLNIAFVLISIFIISLQSCVKDSCKKSCFGCVELDQQFHLTYDCPAVFRVNDQDVFEISLINIDDRRTLGNGCSLSTGGTIESQFHVYSESEEIIREFHHNGCSAAWIPDIEIYQLGYINFDEYKIYPLKVYPRSRTINEYPELDAYEILMQIKKK